MQIKVKPKVVKRVSFSVPRGITDLKYEWSDKVPGTWESRYEPRYKTEVDAAKNDSIIWDDPYNDYEEMFVTVTRVKERLLVLIGTTIGDPEIDQFVSVGTTYFKLTPTIAKKLIWRALNTEAGKVALPTDKEKEEIKTTRRGPRFERVSATGRGAKLFLFTAPCGDTSVIREGTLVSMVEAITLAEKELK